MKINKKILFAIGNKYPIDEPEKISTNAKAGSVWDNENAHRNIVKRNEDESEIAEPKKTKDHK